MATTTPNLDISEWRRTHLRADRDHAPRSISTNDYLRVVRFARRDARVLDWPALAPNGQLLSRAWNHVDRLMTERFARLAEVLDEEVAPLRQLAELRRHELVEYEEAIQRALAARDAIPPLDENASNAAEARTDIEVRKSRRRAAHAAEAARAAHAISDARQRSADAAKDLRDLVECMQERWDLYVSAVRSWEKHRDRFGVIISRHSARFHSNPNAAAGLIHDAMAVYLNLPATNPWSLDPAPLTPAAKEIV